MGMGCGYSVAQTGIFTNKQSFELRGPNNRYIPRYIDAILTQLLCLGLRTCEKVDERAIFETPETGCTGQYLKMSELGIELNVALLQHFCNDVITEYHTIRNILSQH